MNAVLSISIAISATMVQFKCNSYESRNLCSLQQQCRNITFLVYVPSFQCLDSVLSSFGPRRPYRSSSSRLIWWCRAPWTLAASTVVIPSPSQRRDRCAQHHHLLERKPLQSTEASQTRTRRAWTGSQSPSRQKRSQRTGLY